MKVLVLVTDSWQPGPGLGPWLQLLVPVLVLELIVLVLNLVTSLSISLPTLFFWQCPAIWPLHRCVLCSTFFVKLSNPLSLWWSVKCRSHGRIVMMLVWSRDQTLSCCWGEDKNTSIERHRLPTVLHHSFSVTFYPHWLGYWIFVAPKSDLESRIFHSFYRLTGNCSVASNAI